MDGSLTAYTESEILIDSSSSSDKLRTKTPRPYSVALEIPTKSLNKETGSTANRVNVSFRSHLLLQASFINSGGSEIKQKTLLYRTKPKKTSSIHRQQRK
jgi:hypothetical protein